MIADDKLFGMVVAALDLSEAFPNSILRGRIALDIRIVRGSLFVGKRIRLSTPNANLELSIVGIEMSGLPDDPTVVRIHCSKPDRLPIPTGIVEGWTIEDP